MFSASSIRFHLLLSTAVAAFSASPAVGQIVHAFPVLRWLARRRWRRGRASAVREHADYRSPRLQPRTIIRWDSFDIDAGNEVDFEGIYTCPCGGTPPPLAVLNRVTGTDSSDILGKLTSEPNIEVFLINPNGILFGSQARVDVGSFVASTLGITDSDFLLGDAVPTELTFQGNVSTGITVNGGAQLTTEVRASGADWRVHRCAIRQHRERRDRCRIRRRKLGQHTGGPRQSPYLCNHDLWPDIRFERHHRRWPGKRPQRGTDTGKPGRCRRCVAVRVRFGNDHGHESRRRRHSPEPGGADDK